MLREPTKAAAVFVLFGATGDLSKRLIVPAMFSLYRAGLLPDRFVLIGVGRHELTHDGLADHYHQALMAFSGDEETSSAAWEVFSAKIRYERLDASEAEAYGPLRAHIEALESEWQEPHVERIFYMATPPSLFCPIAASLGNAGLAEDNERTRIVVEKPLGRDFASSRAINQTLLHYFNERQIYRIDHFLGKETVQNILVMRFANPIFEPVWNRRYVDHVTITVAETLGMEHRGDYYERAGALRDMVQNHLLQLLCLVAMEPPVAYDAEDIRGKKLEVLRSVRPIPRDNVADFAARGQYAEGWIEGRKTPAYRAEPGTDRLSNTETFAALKLFVDNWRWQDVPFYLRTGKRLANDVSEISIRFKDVPHRAFTAAVGMNAQPVRLVIQIQPRQGIVLKFMAKEPGLDLHLRPVAMRFCYQDEFEKPVPKAYETLLWDILHGDATLFMRADQVETAWQIVEPVLSVWEEIPPLDFPNYVSGSWGPESSELLVAADGRSWLTPTLIRHEGC